MAIALVPARFASSRLPGKPLLAETGKALVVHACEAIRAVGCIERVVVATDDKRIAQVVQQAGFEWVMTRADHPNGTSRLAEAAALLGLPDEAIVVNAQGDEPDLDGPTVERLVAAMEADVGCPMGTVATPFPEGVDAGNPHVVKVVTGLNGRALYFSRAPIPWDRDAGRVAGCVRKHLGLYAYRRSFLPVYAALPESPLEQLEKLEQLRVLEHGHPIVVVEGQAAPAGVDTPEQYAAFVARWRALQGD